MKKYVALIFFHQVAKIFKKYIALIFSTSLSKKYIEFDRDYHLLEICVALI